MGFNFGAALGAAAKSGTETYAMIEEQKRKDAEAARQAEVHEAWKKEQGGKEALRQAVASAGDLTQAIPAGNFAGPAPQEQPQEGGYQTPGLSSAQKAEQFQQRAVANGADPTAVQQYMASHFQLQNLKRENDVNEQYTALKSEHDKKFADLHTGMQDTFAKDGAVGFLKAYGDQYTKETGNTIKLMGNNAIVTDSKGKPVGEPIPVSQLPMAAEEALKQHYTQSFTDELVRKNLFSSAKDAVAFQIEQQKLRLQGITAGATAKNAETQAAELDAKIASGLFPAQAKQALGAANASNAHAAVYSNMLTLAKENKAAGDAMKPFITDFAALTPEEQQGAKGMALLTAGAAAAAKKTGDVTGIISALKKPDLDTKLTVNPDGTVTKGGALYVPDPSNPGSYKPAGGLAPSALDKAIAGREKQGSKQEGGLNAAAPTVEGRPLYNTPMSDLQRMAKKPKGVSTAEANDAASELEARKGESRISAIPR